MHLTINGDAKTLEKDALTVSDLLVLNQVEQPDVVSVQLNGEFVDRDKFQSTLLKENDEVDFLYFLGGGSR